MSKTISVDEIKDKIVSQCSGSSCVIGIVGMGASGKTILAKELAILLDGKHFNTDGYLKDFAWGKENGYTALNPKSFDSQLNDDLVKIRKGITFEKKLDSVNGEEESVSYIPASFTIVEGVALYHCNFIFDYLIHLEISADLEISRRLIRDKTRGFDEYEIHSRWKLRRAEFSDHISEPEADLSLRVTLEGFVKVK